MINAQAVSKSFISYKKAPGIIGSLKSFFVREPLKISAVSDFDLVIEPGEIVGLLGPNGAGKTTLIKLLSGVVSPSSGTLQVLGTDPFKRSREFRKRVALVMGQKTQLWWDIPAMDSFLLLQRYYEVDKKEFKQRLDMLGTLLGVTQLFQINVRRLSLGERMKMELMACLLHNPELLFLDEPTIGLDVIAQKQIREFFIQYHQQNRTTIILTSHYMADIEALCPRIVLILKGRKRFDGSIQKFEHILGREKFVSLQFSQAVDPQNPLWANLNPVWSENNSRVELQIAEESLREVIIELMRQFPVIDFSTEKLAIERVLKTLLANPNLIPE